MKRQSSILCIAIAACLLATSVHAGTVLVVETEGFGSSASKGTATIYLEPHRLRIESTEGGADLTVIYRDDGDAPRYWIINNETKSYVDVTTEDIERSRAGVERRRRELEQQMRTLPPDQQEQFRRIYRDQLGAIDLEGAPEYRRVASGTQVRDWKCDHYQGFRGGDKREDVWAASWDELDVNREDVTILGKLAGVFEALGQQMPAFFHFGRAAAAGESDVDGFPVLVLTYGDSGVKEKSQLIETQRKSFKPQLFELPDGLIRQMPDPVRY